MKKRIISIFFVVLMAAAMTACGSKEGSSSGKSNSSGEENSTKTGDKSSSAAEEKSITIAYCTEILDENETGYANAVQYGIDQYNARDDAKFHIEDLVKYDANGDVDTQNSQLEDCVATGVDLVILTCVDDVGNKTGAQYCIDNGVKVIDVRGGLYGTADVVCCPCAFANEAAEMRQWWEGYMSENPNTKLNIGVVFATPESTSSFVRVDWVYDFADKYDTVNVIAKDYGEWATDPTQKIVEDWIQTYPDMNLIVCANDEEALGAVNALQAADRLDDVMVTGINGGTSGTSMLQNDQLTVTVGQLKDQAGLAYLEVALKLLQGEKVDFDKTGTVENYDKDYEFLRVITPDTADDWIKYKSQFPWW